ncbi:type II toxin-antitoxin system HipA family toxin [Paragemmobacter straminiformis]|uniref:Type II toxin-antitoxin system HipA family toxin n=1 Tax=Paragemmobacter straminiformis TaxID=2045119 RepID=A0A842I3S3_9RHOB|nr:HipA domain-containing protein [Gemmobacter straminiformis]MBC2834500.1 type II toxin-antitoxin system HipA family toxin [Gemmobacter straminiformis]
MKRPALLAPALSAYVWIWLPEATEPVVCGRIDLADGINRFTYGKSYLARPNAIPIWLPELPLVDAVLVPEAPHVIAGALRDAAPDQWGRRVVLNRQFQRRGRDVDTGDLDELNYLLLSGSDRIGALDFQTSPTAYVPRLQREARLEELLNAAEAVEAGVPLSPDLDDALRHGTSIGGARPKAQLVDGNRKLIAKFAASRDTHNVVQGEYLAMKLAQAVGLDVAPVQLVKAAGKDVLLVERFDRIHTNHGFLRRAMVSSLTLQGLDETAARYASYPAIADAIRHRAADPSCDLRELWSRMLFNILVGNTDDHARNHACFWDGRSIRLTPAYDIDPRPRLGREANQAMAVTRTDRRSRIATALDAVGHFSLRRDEAVSIAKRQIETIRARYRELASHAGIDPALQDLLAGRAILNPYVFEDSPEEIAALEGPL